MLGPLHQISTFLRDPPHPSQNRNFHLMDKIADFLQNKRFISDSPEGFAFFGPVGSIFSAPDHVQHLF